MAWQGDVVLVVIFFLVIIAPILFVFNYASNTVQGVFDNMSIVPNSVKTQMHQVTGNYSIFDQGVPFLVIAMLVVNLILGAYVSVNPQNFVIGFLGMIVLTVASFFISNAAYAIIAVPILAPIAAHYPTILAALDNIPIIVTIFDGFYLIVILLAYYRRRGRE